MQVASSCRTPTRSCTWPSTARGRRSGFALSATSQSSSGPRGETIDWHALVSRAESVGARTALHMVLDLARQLLDADVPGEVLRATSPGRMKRAMLERTCGATPMFHRVSDDDVRQQPHLVLRVLEQDGALTIARAGARAPVRKRSKWRYNRRLRTPVGG